MSGCRLVPASRTVRRKCSTLRGNCPNWRRRAWGSTWPDATCRSHARPIGRRSRSLRATGRAIPTCGRRCSGIPTAPIGMRHIRFSSSTGTMRAAMCRCRSASRFSGSSRSARTCSGRSSPYGRPNTPCERPRNRWKRKLRRRSSTPERRGSDTAERSDTSPRPRRPPGRSHASTTSAPRP
ncbi:hypothetical protein BN3659_02521 [Alistipes sp. CHKCI003]|nr:hypothetical protein BN3659_02521 [Alistipes sp. CHKCI003]